MAGPHPVARDVALATVAAVLVLGGCGGGGGGGGETARRYAQADLAGTWDLAKLRVGASPGWERATASVNAAGAVTLLSYLDSAGNTDPGPQDSNVVVDPDTGDLSSRVGAIAAPFHGTLSRRKDLFAAVETPEAATYALMLARRRGGAAYSDADLRGRTFALHALRTGGTVGEWRYGTGSVDAQGVVALGPVIGPQLVEVAKPPPHGATLTVDADGLVSDGAGFQGFLSPDKNVLVAVHPDPSAAPEQQLTILVFTGRTFAQADLEGSWAANAFAGNVAPIWYHANLVIGPTGSAEYVPPYLDSAGASTLPPVVTIALAADGTMTQGAANPSYRGTLSTNGELYVRTQTHQPPGRYGLGVALRR